MLIKGIGISQGVASGPVFFICHEPLTVPHTFVKEGEENKEYHKYLLSKEELLKTLKEKEKLRESEKEIIESQREIIKDVDVDNFVHFLITKNFYSAAWAVEEVSLFYSEKLEKVEDEYIKERKEDVLSWSRKIIDILLEKKRKINLTSSVILWADYLTPSEFLSLDKTKLLGVVLEKGSPISHIAILLKSFSLPTVVAKTTKEKVNGEMIIVDGNNNLVIIKPNEDEIKKAQKEREKEKRDKEELEKLINLPSITLDREEIEISASIETVSGLTQMKRVGVKDVGLFRSEFLFIEGNNNTKESYKELIDKIDPPSYFTLRTTDFKDDKKIEETEIVKKTDKEKLKEELKDVFTLSSNKKIKILFPMITSLDNLEEKLKILNEVLREEKIERKIEVGAMIEVPSAAVLVKEIGEKVDFISVGTNDLVKFTLSLDRNETMEENKALSLNPAILVLLSYIVKSVDRKKVSLCGEMASSISYLPLLLGLGYRRVCVTPNKALEVKRRIRELKIKDCENLASTLLKMKSEKEIRKELDKFNGRFERK